MTKIRLFGRSGMVEYRGNLILSGTAQTSLGEFSTYSGTLGVDLVLSFGAAGATVVETVQGTIITQTASLGQIFSNTIPISFSTPSSPYEWGSFDINDQVPLSGLGINLDLHLSSHELNGFKSSVGSLTATAIGIYQGVGIAVSLTGTGTLDVVPDLTPLATFATTDAIPAQGGLAADGAGNLFGLMDDPYSSLYGRAPVAPAKIYEIAAHGGTYASAPAIIATLPAEPVQTQRLIIDAAGNLFGATATQIFKLPRLDTGYGALTSVAAPNVASIGTISSGLIRDPQGDLFGTAQSSNGDTVTIFEAPFIGEHYGSIVALGTLTVPAVGNNARFSPIMDRAGDIFGIVLSWPSPSDYLGSIYELKKTGSGYATAPVLVAASSATGGHFNGLAVDGDGNLFVSTDIGWVLEVPKLGASYGTPTLIAVVSMWGLGTPLADSLMVDAAGNLFGTGDIGAGRWNVYEIPKSGIGYANPVLVTSSVTRELAGSLPAGSLLADDKGNLFASTQTAPSFASATNQVVEISNTGYVPPQRAISVANNFSGSNTSDVLWQNGGGAIALWGVQNGVATAATSPGSLSAGWSLAGTGNFHGNRTSDLLFRNQNGVVDIWQMANRQAVGTSVAGVTTSDWAIAGTGDFNGDGTDDILFRNVNGGIAEWQLQHGTFVATTVLGVTTPDWTIAATGNLTGAGRTDDILFISNNGYVADWIIAGGRVVSANILGRTNAYWSIEGMGDLGGNGQNDILFRGQGGEIVTWLTRNGQVIGSELIGMTTADWQVASIGDYNGDRTDDILFRNSASGKMATWLLDSAQLSGVTTMGSVTDGWRTMPF